MLVEGVIISIGILAPPYPYCSKPKICFSIVLVEFGVITKGQTSIPVYLHDIRAKNGLGSREEGRLKLDRHQVSMNQSQWRTPNWIENSINNLRKL